MKLLVFAVCALACLTLANTKPCQGSTCGGYHYNNKRQISDGGFNSQGGFHAEYVSSNANAVDEGTDDMDRSDFGGGANISGDSDDKEDGFGRSGGYGGIYGGRGRYNRRNYYCPTCYGENFGKGGANFNTVTIRRIPKQSRSVTQSTPTENK